MKQGFFSGILVTIVGGALLWFGTQAYTDWKSSRNQVARFGIDEEYVVVTPDLQNIVELMSAKNKIASIDIENKGSGDLAGFEINISDQISTNGENIIDFGVLSTVGERAERPSIEKIDGNIVARWPILRPGESSKLWIANKGYSTFSVRNSQSGIILEEGNSLQEADDDFWGFVKFAGLILGAFVLGMIASESLNNHVLRRIGFDPKEVAKLYAAEEKKKSV